MTRQLQTVSLNQHQRIELDRVVILLRHGWVLLRSVGRSFAQTMYWITNDFVRFKVSRESARELIDKWVEFFNQDGQYYYYKLK